MNKKLDVMIAAGDVGGARALIAFLEVLANTNYSFSIVDNGFIRSEIKPEWSLISVEIAKSKLENNQAKVLFFSRSTKDTVPLELARIGKKTGVKIVCVLDNWMNYALGMEIDGLPIFLPDIYTMPDQLSFQAALEEGFPKESMVVTGQPALSSLAKDFNLWKNDMNQIRMRNIKKRGKKTIVFISEPVEKDQGDYKSKFFFRGYTEKTVLDNLCMHLQPYSEKFRLNILPHPRENQRELNEVWQSKRGKLEGKMITEKTGREVIFNCDLVAGMVSILLYEAWLIGKPMISLQPGLLLPQFTIHSKKPGYRCLTDPLLWETEVKGWLSNIENNNLAYNASLNPEYEIHSQSCYNIIKILDKLII